MAAEVTLSFPMASMPEEERPRERLLARGVEALSDRELLALVLRTGTRGQSAIDVATSLLAEHGSVGVLATLGPEELASRSGIGVAKATSVVAAFHLARRMGGVSSPRRLRSSADVADVVRTELSALRRERLLVLVCDGANGLLWTKAVSEGAADRSLVPVREILNAVLRHDGKAFALAHNHPSGDPEPSDADRRVTEEIRTAAGVTGLRFLGHIVVAGARWEAIS